MSDRQDSRLVFDWAAHGPDHFIAQGEVMLDDETLRDGLQSPSVTDPDLDTKLRILHLMDSLGIEMPPQLENLGCQPPPARTGGTKVDSVADLVAALKDKGVL